MAITRVTLATVAGRVISALNAGTAGTWTTTIVSSDDPRRNQTEINNAILAADAQVCMAICETLGHGYRSLFLAESADITHLGVIPDHIGPIEQVRIQYASTEATYRAGKFDKHLTLDDIERWRFNAVALYGGVAHNVTDSGLAGFYIVMGNQVFFTGNACRMHLANITRTGACQAPEVYEDTVFGLALGNLIKEGDRGPFTEVAVRDARMHLKLIREGRMELPPLALAEAA